MENSKTYEVGQLISNGKFIVLAYTPESYGQKAHDCNCEHCQEEIYPDYQGAEIVGQRLTIATHDGIEVNEGELHFGTKAVANYDEYCKITPKFYSHIPERYTIRGHHVSNPERRAGLITTFDLLDDGQVWCCGFREYETEEKNQMETQKYPDIHAAVDALNKCLPNWNWEFYIEEEEYINV